MRKQVIFLMTDTTRKDMVGCYGYPKMKTPNLDRLAEEGIRYENAYTCQPVCGPARSAIFTGTFPHTNGMVTNSIALGDNVKTIGQRLYDHGIQCGYIGKWHLDGSDYFGNGRCPEGWDPEYWYDMKTYLNELTDEEKVKSRNPKECYKDDFSEEFTYAHRCSNRAIKYLEKHQNNDFFLSVSYDEPHGPSLCPKPYNHMYDGFKFDSCPNFQDDLSKKPFMAPWQGNLNALVAECSEHTFLQYGKRIDGTMYSCTSMGLKIGSGLGTAIVGWLLDFGGFNGQLKVQSQSCINMLHFMYLWLPMIINILVALLLTQLNVEKANEKLRIQKEIGITK